MILKSSLVGLGLLDLGSYPAGLPASQQVTGAQWSGRWYPRHGRWLKRNMNWTTLELELLLMFKQNIVSFIQYAYFQFACGCFLLSFTERSMKSPACIYCKNLLSTMVSQKMILTLANRVLETSDAVNELSVLLKTCLSGRDGISWSLSQVWKRKEQSKMYRNDKDTIITIAFKDSVN